MNELPADCRKVRFSENKTKRPPASAGGLFAWPVVPLGEVVRLAAVSVYEALAVRMGVSIGVGAGGAGRCERSHPAESQELGIENSDQPHSTQTCTSGEGFMGGWLSVRGKLR